jgi:hypothetical protein
MQRRDFVKIAPAAAIAASLPLAAHAEMPVSDGDPIIVWNKGEPLLEEFPEARTRVYKDGCQIGGIKHLNSRLRRVVYVPGLGMDPVDTSYDAVTVSAPLDVGTAMRDANVLPRHWVVLNEPCLRIISRETILLGKSGRSVEKIVVSLPVEKHNVTTTPYGSGCDENAYIWHLESDGRFRHEEGYLEETEETDEFSPEDLHEVLENSVTINGWIELRWTDGIGHSFFSLQEGEKLEEQLSPTRPARLVDLTKLR